MAGGGDQAAWPIAARELPNLRARLRSSRRVGRVDDAERFAVSGYGPIACHFDRCRCTTGRHGPARSTRPRRAVDGVGVCGRGVGRGPRGDLDGAAAWLRRGVRAIEAGSDDEGLVARGSDASRPVGWRARGERCVPGPQRGGRARRAAISTGRSGSSPTPAAVEEALDAAVRLGNKLLIALARTGTPHVERTTAMSYVSCSGKRRSRVTAT